MPQKHWTHGTNRTRYTVKLAELALRAQRLLIAKKIDGIAGMVGMYAPALASDAPALAGHPHGRGVLQQIQDALRQSRATLRSK